MREIYSYGIILTTTVNVRKYYFVINRGHTFEYVDLFNKQCPIHKIPNYVRMCSSQERQRLKRYIDNFEVIYNDAFDTFQTYECMFERYQIIKPLIEKGLEMEPIENTQSTYGFPKGRSKRKEEPLETALREFEEEVHISRDLIFHTNKPILEERYVGSDEKKYINRYFTFETDSILIPCKERSKSIVSGRKWRISNEILDTKWMTKKECLIYLDKSLHRFL